jgi:hypothetical protein
MPTLYSAPDKPLISEGVGHGAFMISAPTCVL